MNAIKIRIGTRTALMAALFIIAMASSASAQMTVNYCSPSGIVNATAPWYCSQINQAVYNAWKPWIPVAMLAILVSFFIGVMVLMAGIILNNNKIRTFGTGEIYESLATALIVIFFMFIAAVMFGLIPSIVTGPIDPYNTSLVYINSTITSTENLFSSLFNTNMNAAFYASMTLSISGIVLATVINAAYSATVMLLYVIPATTIADILVQGLLVLHIEFYLILFFMYAAIPVFLIPGIIFRALLPTRGFGGMLIAIAIGFYFVMPMLFSVVYYFTNNTVLATLNSETASINAYGGGTGSQTNAVSPTSPLVETISGIQSSMGSFWLSIAFYPALITALTYMIITTLAEFIGGFAHKVSKASLF